MHISTSIRVICSTTSRFAVFSHVTNFPRYFHDYFVTHLPSSSLHPDSRSATGPHHQLPRSASKPHIPPSRPGPSPAPLLGVTRDTTVVRIPLRSAKHHFGVSVSRGCRPYNEDTYQAGVVDLPAFAKRVPLTLTRAPGSSPLVAYREGQRKQEEKSSEDGGGTGAESTYGDPQVFYFGVFDGHGGTECSGFLREQLHEFVEDAAHKYHLQSTLKGSPSAARGNQDGPIPLPSEMHRGPREKAFDTENATSGLAGPKLSNQQAQYSTTTSSSISQPGSQQISANLQSALMKSWRDTVGGYFRRFQPQAFSPMSSQSPSICTILTHAFLAADLSFLSTQLRRSLSADDPVLADLPLNASDNLSSPSLSATKIPFKGGSTCSVALISTPTPAPFWHPSSPSTLLTAHCGDTRILLCRTSDGLAIPLTTDHHPNTPSENDRLRRWAAAFVTDSFGEERMGGLANTRSFGDMSSKRLGVSAEPEIRTTEMRPGEYSFLVLVSDGVSGVCGDQEIVDTVKEARTPEQGAREVVAFATEVSAEGDNATCLVVRLGGWERRSEGGGGGWRTREGREWRRKEAANPRNRTT